MTVKRLRLILTPIDVGGACLIELDGKALHLTAEVDRHARPVLTLTNLRVDVEAEAVIDFERMAKDPLP